MIGNYFKRINEKMIEAYVEGQFKENGEPKSLKVSITILNQDIALFWIALSIFDLCFFYSGYDDLSSFGMKYGTFLTNYLIVLLAENIFPFRAAKKDIPEPEKKVEQPQP